MPQKKNIKKERIMEKKLSFNEFKNRADSRRDKVDSFLKDLQVETEHWDLLFGWFKTVSTVTNKIAITMMDKRNGEINRFCRSREITTDILIHANFLFVETQRLEK